MGKIARTKCTSCNNGWVWVNTGRDCPKCDGCGIIYSPVTPHLASRCTGQGCSGGKIYKYVKCKICKGKGWI